jgi:hypothetical protein
MNAFLPPECIQMLVTTERYFLQMSNKGTEVKK